MKTKRVNYHWKTLKLKTISNNNAIVLLLENDKIVNLKQLQQKLLARLKDSPSPTVDVLILASFVLKKDIGYLLAHPELTVSKNDRDKIRRLVKRRAAGEPIAYITGKKEFYGLDFKVDKNVLIPRPETETLVEQALESIKSKVHQVHKVNIIDMGTGSGNIIISIAKWLTANGKRLTAKLYAIDINSKSLIIAKQNARAHKVNHLIKFYQSDLFSNPKLPKKFDLIIANLPYVPISSRLTAYGLRLKYEPQNAIFADNNGMAVIKKFLAQAKTRLNKNGRILIELDPRNANHIKKYAADNFPNKKIELKKDLAKFNRYLVLSDSNK